MLYCGDPEQTFKGHRRTAKNKDIHSYYGNKSTVLDTIKSRLPIKVLSEKSEEVDLGLDLKQLSLATVYDFTQSHKRTDVQKYEKLWWKRIAKEACTTRYV